MENKIVIITGIFGQDGSYLSELLLNEGYKVIGVKRHTQSRDYSNIKHILNHSNLIIEEGDVTDFGSMSSLVSKYKPDYFYHLAANSFVQSSWGEPTAVLNINAGGTLNCLEAIRLISPQTRFYFASTSEVVGNSKSKIQDENTIPTCHSPYSASKLFGEHITQIYNKSYGLFAVWGRLYNHESPRRGKEFVTRKISNWIGVNFNIVQNSLDELYPRNQQDFISSQKAFEKCLELGKIEKLKLGNLQSARDWGYAKDYVRAMKLILEYKEPENFVISTNTLHSIIDLLNISFSYVGINNWEPFVESSSIHKRPDDVTTLQGDYSKAKKILGWEPTITFKELIEKMVENDICLNK